jgi:hypothetical protein
MRVSNAALPNRSIGLYRHRFKGELFADALPAKHDVERSKIGSFQTYCSSPDTDQLVGKVHL